MENQCKTLREVLSEEAVFSPCVYDCITAKIVEKTGFKAMCLSGSSVAAGLCGLPDIGMVTLEDLLEVVSRITTYAKIPMIVDIDTGFGNELNVMRTCERVAAAGAMAVHLEDQTFPKRCGHLNGKEVIPAKDYFRKVKAAKKAFAGSDCLLIARTDSYHTHGVEEAIYRNLGSLEAGADITFTEGTGTIPDIERLAREVPGWKMFDMLVKGASPKVTFEELVDYGYRLVTAPAVSTGGATVGLTEAAQAAAARRDGSYAAEQGWTVERMLSLVDAERWAGYGEEYCG